MIKVKLFKDLNEIKIEEKINNFIEDKVFKVIDIKFNITKDINDRTVYNALLLYKGKGEDLLWI